MSTHTLFTSGDGEPARIPDPIRASCPDPVEIMPVSQEETSLLLLPVTPAPALLQDTCAALAGDEEEVRSSRTSLELMALFWLLLRPLSVRTMGLTMAPPAVAGPSWIAGGPLSSSQEEFPDDEEAEEPVVLPVAVGEVQYAEEEAEPSESCGLLALLVLADEDADTGSWQQRLWKPRDRRVRFGCWSGFCCGFCGCGCLSWVSSSSSSSSSLAVVSAVPSLSAPWLCSKTGRAGVSASKPFTAVKGKWRTQEETRGRGG